MSTMASKLKDRTVRRLNKEKKVLRMQLQNQTVHGMIFSQLIGGIRDLMALEYSGLEILSILEYMIKQIKQADKKRRKEVKNGSSNR